MQQWEYKIINVFVEGVIDAINNRRNKNPLDKISIMINNLGKDGWELVNVVPYQMGGYVFQYIFSFKRPIE